MKQTVQLRLGQQLKLTPQLQQAIRLLQLSTVELQQEIQDALDSNIMLEVDDETRAKESSVADETPVERAESENKTEEAVKTESTTDIPDELPVDANWESIYPDSQQGSTSTSNNNSAENSDFEYQRSASINLRDHLIWQIELLNISERDLEIATAIIYAVNDNGYLGLSIDEIYSGLQGQIEELELDEVQGVLCRVQSLDPPGVAAVDLTDCLRIQLNQLAPDTPWLDEAKRVVKGGLDYLAANKVSSLQRMLGVSQQELGEVLCLIRSLNPSPGDSVASSEPQYVTPDVTVAKHRGVWTVFLNASLAPRLRINSTYSGMISGSKSSQEDLTCMRSHLQEARWFLKSLENRNETILKVARCIVETQQEFFEKGPKYMKPLVLRTVAEAVEMHESTISRVTTNKYLDSPNGIFEFKYFFSSHVAMDSGSECSSTAIKAFLQELISQEDAAKPLSDSKLVELLKQRDIVVARRTIAKYREMMGVLPSSKRKRVI